MYVGEYMKNKTKSKVMSLQRQEEIFGYLFILPFAIGFLLFSIAPTVSSFIISMTNMSFVSNVSDLKFIGADNFIKLLIDSNFHDAFLRTLYYTLLFVPGSMIISLMFAFLINSRLYFRGFVRTAIFIPYVSNIVAIASVWSLILDVTDGPVNTLLTYLGVENPPLWLLGQKTVIPTIVLIVVWQNIGFYMMLYLAALQNVPRELYEAAIIDGAGRFQKFRNITIPMISPTTFLLIVTTIISSFQSYGPIQALTKGGPGSASKTLAINIVQESFVNYKIGYSTAKALVVFVLILGITVIQWRGQKKWVNY